VAIIHTPKATESCVVSCELLPCGCRIEKRCHIDEQRESWVEKQACAEHKRKARGRSSAGGDNRLVVAMHAKPLPTYRDKSGKSRYCIAAKSDIEAEKRLEYEATLAQASLKHKHQANSERRPRCRECRWFGSFNGGQVHLCACDRFEVQYVEPATYTLNCITGVESKRVRRFDEYDEVRTFDGNVDAVQVVPKQFACDYYIPM